MDWAKSGERKRERRIGRTILDKQAFNCIAF
jgi:hypothetical protein